MSAQVGKERSSLLKLEDWWAVWIGLFVCLLGLGPTMFGSEFLGWVVKVKDWTNLSKSLGVVSKESFQWMSGFTALIVTYLFMLAITTVGASIMGKNVKRFVAGFTIIFWLTNFCSILGKYAYIGASPEKIASLKIPWSLGLGEIGLIFAMIVGLLIGNFFPKLADFLKEAALPEWYIKTGIVILGASLGIKTIEAASLASTIIVRGVCAVVEAYLIYWPLVYFISRKFFKFTPEWAAPLASGVSICGVSACIATGSAIRSRPVVPVVLSAVIIVFVSVELLFMPWLATTMLSNDPLVAGSWMGLAVKSDGGAIASGTLTESMIYAKVLAETGVSYAKDWVLMVTTTTKVFIDIFIGVWAFILAIVWSVFPIDRASRSAVAAGTYVSHKVSPIEIWERFPKFIIGFIGVMLGMFVFGLANPDIIKPAKLGMDQANTLRSLFFALCFFSIGLVTNVRKLWAEGMGRIVTVYVVCLFGFILWIGLLISYLFYHGIMPPLA